MDVNVQRTVGDNCFADFALPQQSAAPIARVRRGRVQWGIAARQPLGADRL